MSVRTSVMAPDGLSKLLDPSGDQPPTLEQDSAAEQTENESELDLEPPSPVSTAPSPNGILFKGTKHRKRVSFRDHNLCNIREIPPRSRSGSSSGDEDSDDDDDDDDSGSSDSGDDSGSDSEEEGEDKKVGGAEAAKKKTLLQHHHQQQQQKQQHTVQYQQTVTYKERGVTVTKTIPVPTPPVPSMIPGAGGPRLGVRAERAPIPWNPSPAFTSPTPPPLLSTPPLPTPPPSTPPPTTTVAKGSYEVSRSPASKVVSLVSQITGVSSAASQAHLKMRNGPAATAAPSQIRANTNSQPKSPTGTNNGSAAGSGGVVMRLERKVKKITPTLDNVISTRSVNKHGASSDTQSHKTNGNGGRTKKKRVFHHHHHHHHKRNEAAEGKRKGAGGSLRLSNKAKENKGKVNGVRPASPAAPKSGVTQSQSSKNKVTVNGLARTRDSLSLPPLGHDDSMLMTSSRALQQLALAKTSSYTLDGNGFIFPGDPAYDLTSGIKTINLTPEVDSKLRVGSSQGSGPAAASNSTLTVRERVNSAPPGGSPVRRRRYYAWQMANGNLQSSLNEQPCITPMWESVQSVNNSVPGPPQPHGLISPTSPLPTTTKPAFIAER